MEPAMDTQSKRKPVILGPQEGRSYEMGRMRAIFKADANEVGERYSVSEWWLEPRTRGPGAHQHPDDHVLYVISGTLSLLVDGERYQIEAGGYAIVVGGMLHDFENFGDIRTGFISFNSPGGFEGNMSRIAPTLAGMDLRM
jgi:quercetin dioxygenase-like cupin family protein